VVKALIWITGLKSEGNNVLSQIVFGREKDEDVDMKVANLMWG
jgi:hypothetical protein